MCQIAFYRKVQIQFDYKKLIQLSWPQVSIHMASFSQFNLRNLRVNVNLISDHVNLNKKPSQ